VNRPVKRFLRVSGIILEWMILSAAWIWAIAALNLDFPMIFLRVPLAVIYALCVLVDRA
jgi:hypothetical protein